MASNDVWSVSVSPTWVVATDVALIASSLSAIVTTAEPTTALVTFDVVNRIVSSPSINVSPYIRIRNVAVDWPAPKYTDSVVDW